MYLRMTLVIRSTHQLTQRIPLQPIWQFVVKALLKRVLTGSKTKTLKLSSRPLKTWLKCRFSNRESARGHARSGVASFTASASVLARLGCCLGSAAKLLRFSLAGYMAVAVASSCTSAWRLFECAWMEVIGMLLPFYDGFCWVLFLSVMCLRPSKKVVPS